MSRHDYGYLHRQERERRAAIYRPGDPCAIGGEPLACPPHMLDLAHDHAYGGYLPGLSCRKHNRSEGATRGNRMRPQRRIVQVITVAKRWW